MPACGAWGFLLLKIAWPAGSVRRTLQGANGQERDQIRRVMGGGGDAVSRVTGDERKGATSLLSRGVKTEMDGTGCVTSADVTAGGCCCAAQQEGRVSLRGARFGQWLHEGCLGCSACRQVDALTSNVSRQRRDANLCSVFFISFFFSRVGRFNLQS